MAENTIELDKAQDWAKTWRDLEDKSPYVNELKGWFVPGVDLTQVTQEGAVDSRMYIGLDGETIKLMLVGVDKDGQDMINAEEGWYIYDATEPCPHKCDIESPLFNVG